MDILLVEDNLELAHLIRAFLQKKGFSLWHEDSAEKALSWMMHNTPRIILLDIMLPEMDGFAFCEKIRHTQDLPILIMSARSAKTDQLMGFELGADDYLEKPVDTDILAAKIRALLNRSHTKIPKDILTSGDIQVDLEARSVFLGGTPLNLNVKEYELLLCFLKHPQKTLYKEYLFNQIWGADSESELQTLTVHIKMLRTKIEEDPRHPKRIITIWGVGYRYEKI